jgi:hypothetical protein
VHNLFLLRMYVVQHTEKDNIFAVIGMYLCTVYIMYSYKFVSAWWGGGLMSAFYGRASLNKNSEQVVLYITFVTFRASLLKSYSFT